MIVIIVLLLAMLWVVSWLDRYTLAKDQRENPGIAIEALPVEFGLESVNGTEKSVGVKEKSLSEA